MLVMKWISKIRKKKKWGSEGQKADVALHGSDVNSWRCEWSREKGLFSAESEVRIKADRMDVWPNATLEKGTMEPINWNEI